MSVIAPATTAQSLPSGHLFEYLAAAWALEHVLESGSRFLLGQLAVHRIEDADENLAHVEAALQNAAKAKQVI
jgi:hypothetical protein